MLACFEFEINSKLFKNKKEQYDFDLISKSNLFKIVFKYPCMELTTFQTS